MNLSRPLQEEKKCAWFIFVHAHPPGHSFSTRYSAMIPRAVRNCEIERKPVRSKMCSQPSLEPGSSCLVFARPKTVITLMSTR